MRLRRFFPVALIAAGLAAPALSEVATKKFDWRPVDGIQKIDLQAGEIVINEVQFDLGSTMKGTPIRKSSAKVKIRIDNNGNTDQEVGAAVVVFDAEGNVVAAGSNGTKWGYLNKGATHVLRDRFPVRVPAPARGRVVCRDARDPGQIGRQDDALPVSAPEPASRRGSVGA